MTRQALHHHAYKSIEKEATGKNEETHEITRSPVVA
jgi:hypothetical protein